MAVKVGSARIDENGHAKDGKAGDQTGKEVSTQNWYKHSKGWRVFRAKNPAYANLIADDMEYACLNKNIGYDQNQRGTLYTVSKPYGFNCKKVKTKCECDCSSLVRVCCAYAGIMLPNFRTSNEASILLNSGYFMEMKGKMYTNTSDFLLRGDILVTKSQGHTVIVLDDGAKAHDDLEGKICVVGNSVNVREEPKKGSRILGIVHKGDLLDCLGIANNNYWYITKYKNQIAYITRKYTEFLPD